ncbi:MAG: hypothetical protein Q9202_007528 [Teloschistes flavicans]
MAYAEQQYQTPDLASILQTLAAFTQPNPSTPQQPPPSHYHHHPPPPTDELEEGEYDPSEFQPIAPQPTTYTSQPYPPQPQTYHQPPPTKPYPYTPPPSTTHHPHPQHQAPLSTPHHHPQPPPPLQKPPPQPPHPRLPAAEKITTYPPALRHTTSLLTTSPHHVARIRHLITTAHTHERQWYAGRQALVKKLAGRTEARAKLSSVLASVGGAAHHASVGEKRESGHGGLNGRKEGGKGEEEEEEGKRELRLYDRKVWKAYGEMQRATEAELKTLAIPFFCLADECVVGTSEEEMERGKGKVGEKELQVLKARMVALLEDLVGD